MVLHSRIVQVCLCGIPHLIAVFCFGHWITSGLHESISFGHLGRIIQKGFSWCFILFLKYHSVRKVFKPLKSCFFILFLLCWDTAHVLWFELQVWTAVLPYVVFYAVLCLYAFVSSCLFASIRSFRYISCFSKTWKWIIGDQTGS